MKYRYLVLLALVLFSSSIAFSQTKKFKWSTEMCDLESTYNSKKFTLKQLKDTAKLVRNADFSLTTGDLPFNIKDLDKMDRVALEKEYAAKRSALENLDVVKTMYFQDLKEQKLGELYQVYTLKRTSIMAFHKPELLLDFKGAPKCVTEYADPLIQGGDALLAQWLKVNKKIREQNSSPENIRRTYEEQLNSPQKFDYARLEVMVFGWWNCANESIRYVDQNGNAEKEFKKLFLRTREISCEMP